MAKKRKKAAKKKQATKRTGNERKTTTANQEIETEAIEKWLRIMDRIPARKRGAKRREKNK